MGPGGEGCHSLPVAGLGEADAVAGGGAEVGVVEEPVDGGAVNVEVSQRVADACLGALAQIARDRVPAAGQGTITTSSSARPRPASCRMRPWPAARAVARWRPVTAASTRR